MPRPRFDVRYIEVAAAGLAVALFLGGALARYRGDAPLPAERITHASAVLAEARQVLDGESDSRDRFRLYRQGLEEADAALGAAVAEAPLHGEPALALAALRWELDPPVPGPRRRALIGLAEAGASIVARRPRAQQRAGETLVRMGERDAGLARLRAAAELDPELTGEVVATLLASAVPADAVLLALPPTAAVLAALEEAYANEEAWLTAVEAFAGAPDPELLRRFGTRCRATAQPGRVVAFAERLGPRDDEAVEVERLIQLAEARLALGEVHAAVESASRAREIAPRDVRAQEFFGTVLLRGGDAPSAATVFREALRSAALGKRPAHERARLYRWLGQAQEARLRPDLAIDAYRLALGLDTEEAVARRRLAALEGPIR